jgi:hypothetical protein
MREKQKESAEIRERRMTPVRRLIYGEEVWIAPFCVMGSEVLVEPVEAREVPNERQN